MKELFGRWKQFLKEENEQTLHFFFDMDGVLADFTNPVAKEINNLISGVVAPYSKKQKNYYQKQKKRGLRMLLVLK